MSSPVATLFAQTVLPHEVRPSCSSVHCIRPDVSIALGSILQHCVPFRWGTSHARHLLNHLLYFSRPSSASKLRRHNSPRLVRRRSLRPKTIRNSEPCPDAESPSLMYCSLIGKLRDRVNIAFHAFYHRFISALLYIRMNTTIPFTTRRLLLHSGCKCPWKHSCSFFRHAAHYSSGLVAQGTASGIQ